jgi:hypothetical protein
MVRPASGSRPKIDLHRKWRIGAAPAAVTAKFSPQTRKCCGKSIMTKKS